MNIVTVTPENAEAETFFCIKDIKNSGFSCKQRWFEQQYKEGLQLKILKEDSGRMIGFIEYLPADRAWRPIEAPNFMFIHCIAVYSKKDRKKGAGSTLIAEAVKEAKNKGMAGICVMASKGPWIADKQVFQRNGFKQVAKKERFELLSLKWNEAAKDPEFLDWKQKQAHYQGWHLLYADQCPWHDKSVFDLLTTAADCEIDIKVTKINTAQLAKNAPSGYGVFNLLHNGKLLADHYISATRFKNILKKELAKS